MRTVLAVIAGYVAMFVVVFVLLTGLYFALGAEKAFQPESFHPSMTWSGLMLGVGFLAAFVGGKVCGAISRGKAITALIAVVVILSLPYVYMAATAEDPGTRDESLSSMEAMAQAQQPLWFTIVNPVVAVLGLMIGGRGSKKK